MAKTNPYTVVFEDGTFARAISSGKASYVRQYLEAKGYLPSVIFAGHLNSLYKREGKCFAKMIVVPSAFSTGGDDDNLA